MPLLLLLLACTVDAGPEPLGDDVACDARFGSPGENTGLDASECRPELVVDGKVVWTPPPVSESDLSRWSAAIDANPAQALADDPYDSPERYVPRPDAVCGLLDGADGYALITYDTSTAALEAGARITHGGNCGACSTLQDLAVYAAIPDLTTPVRQCGLDTFNDGHDAAVACLEAIGFTPACADIWAWNTAHTRKECLSDCLALLDAPYHQEDGAPNACIQCDEDLSGPVFKAVAGRTRRNSGLPTALCRPCGTVWRIDANHAP